MAIGFDRASAEVLYNTAQTPPITGYPNTIACWFNASSIPSAGEYYTLVSLCDYSGASFFSLMLDGDEGGSPSAWAYLSTIAWASATADPVASTWYHAAAVQTSPTSRAAFMNGANKGTDDTNKTPTGIDCSAVGSVIYSNGLIEYLFDGLIAEAGMWDVALTDEEIAVLAAGYSPLLVRPQNLVWYMPLVRNNHQDIIGGISYSEYNTPTIENHCRIIYPAVPIIGADEYAAAGAYTLEADHGSFSLSGQAVSLLAGRKIAAAHGSYSLSGQAAGLTAGRLLMADHGSFTLSGQDANLLATRLLTAAHGSFSLSGQAADLLRGLLLTAENGSLTLSGQDVDLLRGLLLSADHGSLTLAGQDASLLRGYHLDAEHGTFSLAGQAATLTYSEGATAYELVAETGYFTLAGQAAALKRGLKLSADHGSLSLSGQAADLLRGYALDCEVGTFTLSGQAASLLRGLVLSGEHGTFTLSGQDITLTYSGKTLASGTVDVTFSAVIPKVTFSDIIPTVTFTAINPKIKFTRKE